MVCVAVGMTSCKAWRTISTTATYTQASDTSKVTTTITTKTVEEYQGVKKWRRKVQRKWKKEVIQMGRFLFWGVWTIIPHFLPHFLPYFPLLISVVSVIQSYAFIWTFLLFLMWTFLCEHFRSYVNIDTRTISELGKRDYLFWSLTSHGQQQRTMMILSSLRIHQNQLIILNS